MKRTMQEIMEQAIGELRETLAGEVAEGEAGYWDPDAWEEEVIEFTRQLGQRMVQTSAEVKAEQAKVQAPFVLAAGKDATPASAGAGSAPVATPVVVKRLRTD